jgi:hypothetical protein
MTEQELIDQAHAAGAPPEALAEDQSAQEMIMHLERDQLVAETFRPVARAQLQGRATAALWALRVFVVLVSLMVVYAFVEQLH